MIGRGRWSHQLGKQRLQYIRPYLVSLHGRVEFVSRVHHAVEQPTVFARQSVIHIQKADRLSIGQMDQICVDPVYSGHGGHVIVSGKESGQKDRGVRGLCPAYAHQRLNSSGRFGYGGILPLLRPHVISSGQNDDDFRVDAVEFPILQTPQDVLDSVRAPAEIARIPAEEVFVPILSAVPHTAGRRLPSGATMESPTK